MAVRAPQLAAEWHPTKSGALTARPVGAGSKRSVGGGAGDARITSGTRS